MKKIEQERLKRHAEADQRRVPHEVSAPGLDALLCDPPKPVRAVFGLVNQGHIPTIEGMLDRYCGWDEINSVIGWAGDAAQEDYIRYLRKRVKKLEGKLRFLVDNDSINDSSIDQEIETLLDT